MNAEPRPCFYFVPPVNPGRFGTKHGPPHRPRQAPRAETPSGPKRHFGATPRAGLGPGVPRKRRYLAIFTPPHRQHPGGVRGSLVGHVSHHGAACPPPLRSKISDPVGASPPSGAIGPAGGWLMMAVVVVVVAIMPSDTTLDNARPVDCQCALRNKKPRGYSTLRTLPCAWLCCRRPASAPIARHHFMYNESLELTAPQHTAVKT
jgi:hypothetical protein